MRTIIAGSRTITNYFLVENHIETAPWRPTEVVCGEARGVDSLGEQWAKNNHIPIRRFPANWDKHGRSAGYIRNAEMADIADALILVWDGKSKGSAMMKKLAEKKHLKIYEVVVQDSGMV